MEFTMCKKRQAIRIYKINKFQLVTDVFSKENNGTEKGEEGDNLN